ncbi:unnamed protein product [Mytilus coruscus]|uniref:THAP-type domain-containing protein n=1 Tax=Mytilus coruscus TaxID=42192 RepID=A0A6J7ZW19_MYTCO|nr:unnamed protein product [Mytilus coruscus]
MAAMSEDEKDFLELSKMGKGSDQHCCVPNCNSNGRRHQVSFHRFPQAGARRNSWIQAIRRDPGPLFNINAYTFVCSLHFIREDFKWTPVRKTLKADAVPTVFSWTRDFTPRRELFKHITPNKKPKLKSENETLLDSISEEVNQEEDIQESEEHLRNPRVIIDCTEIPTERPSSLALNSKCYSTYKSTHTFKSLVGIAPHGALIFISSLYTGSMSDVEITKLCGLVELLEEGDSIMVDKGFVLNNVLSGTGITVNTPPFLMNKGQFTKQEVEETQTIARLRIHVERHIRRVKEFHLLTDLYL